MRFRNTGDVYRYFEFLAADYQAFLEAESKGRFRIVCGSRAGLRLARYLMRFTGEARYGHWIEKLVYNGIGSALPLLPGGSNFYYPEYNVKGGRKQYNQFKWPFRRLASGSG
jgi:hypothetical protein